MNGSKEQITIVETKRRPGRKKDPAALVFKTVGMPAWAWDWLALWMPTGNPTTQLRELLERAAKFWPAGPGAFR